MSENIQSIANGSFVLGQTSATNFVAGNGIKIDEPSAGTVRIGNDETVLWSTELGAQGVISAALSESYKNFEKIEVWWAQQGVRTLVQQYFTDTLNQMYCLHGKYMNGVYIFVAAWDAANNTTFNKTFCKYKDPSHWDGNNWTDANELCPCKIVGINRISGGNE